MTADITADITLDSPIDRDFTLRCLQDLVRIDSRNPGLEDGAPGEAEAALYVADRLREVGWEPEFQEIDSHEIEGDTQRVNVVARRPGSGGGPSLMVNVHLDTVGIEGMDDPFRGELRDGRVWGRGSQDIKSGAAATLALAKALSESGQAQSEPTLRGDLVLAFVVDEEDASLGTEQLVREVRTDAALVLEPTELDVCVAHRGFGVFRLRTRGRVAHGGRSDLGVDANLHMARLLTAVDELRLRWQREHRHEHLGSATLHVPRVAGGHQLFAYSGECTAHVECRTIPGQEAESVLAELRALAATLASEIDGFSASVDLVQWREPFAVDPDAPIVRAVRTALEDVRGRPPRMISHPWWEDSALLAAAGIETVVVGPIGDGLHTEEEWVDAESVVTLGRALYRTVLDYCGTPPGETSSCQDTTRDDRGRQETR